MFAANLRDLLLAAPAGHARDAGPGPRFPHGREGGRGRRDRQGRGDGRRPPARPGGRVGRGARQAGPARRGARGRADRDRQRHRVPRDRQARRRTHREAPGAEAHQGDGVRGGRVGVLGVAVRLAGTAGHGRVAARRRLHRPPAPGPAGRAGEDRPEVDRCRPVPARPVRGEAVPLAGRGRRGLCERRRCGRQHGVGAAPRAGVGHLRRARREHRRAPGPERPVQVPLRAEEGGAARPEGVRAVRGVPAHPRRRRPAGRLQRAPRPTRWSAAW